MKLFSLIVCLQLLNFQFLILINNKGLVALLFICWFAFNFGFNFQFQTIRFYHY